MKKSLLGLSLSAVLLLAGCQDGGSTVASTTAGKIREADLYAEMKDRYGQQTLSTMLVEDALGQRYGDQVTEEEVQAGLETDAEKYGGIDAFSTVLQSQGMSIEDYEDSVRLFLLMEQAVLEYSPITDEELQEAYELYQPEVTTSHILVEDEETAQEVLAKLEDGGDWNELVAEYSTDTGTVPNNGQVKFQPGENQVVKEYEEAALALEEGSYTTEPVQSVYGYHIIRLDERPEKGSFEEEKDQLAEKALDAKMQNTQLVQTAIGQALVAENVQIEDQDLQGALQNFIPQTDEEGNSSDSQGSSSSVEESTDSAEEDTSEESETSSESEDSSSGE